jgi:hypothetical protein
VSSGTQNSLETALSRPEKVIKLKRRTFCLSPAQDSPDACAKERRCRHRQRCALSLLFHLWLQHFDLLNLFPKLRFVYACGAVICRALGAAGAASKRPF